MKTEQLKSVTLNFGELEKLTTWLAEAMLHGSELRSRTKIVDVLVKESQDFDKTRIELVKKYAELDKKTKEPLMNEDGKSFKMKDMAGFAKEWGEALEKTAFTFDILPSNEQDWKNVKNIILNLKKDFNYGEGIIYTEICDKLENKSDVVKQAEELLDK